MDKVFVSYLNSLIVSCRVSQWRTSYSSFLTSTDTEGKAQVGVWVCIWSITCICKGNQIETVAKTHWNLIGSSMTAPPPLSSPSNILPPFWPHCAFFPPQVKIGHAFKKCYSILLLFKNYVIRSVSVVENIILVKVLNPEFYRTKWTRMCKSLFYYIYAVTCNYLTWCVSWNLSAQEMFISQTEKN